MRLPFKHHQCLPQCDSGWRLSTIGALDSPHLILYQQTKYCISHPQPRSSHPLSPLGPHIRNALFAMNGTSIAPFPSLPTLSIGTVLLFFAIYQKAFRIML
jgi:hypothetical protein